MSEVQRLRILAAMADVACERGFEAATVAHVVARAGVSRRTFYDLFVDRHECFLATFEEALERGAARVTAAYAREERWLDGVRGGLFALLGFLDEEPELARLCVVEALAAGPGVLDRRRTLLAGLAGVVDGGRAEARGRDTSPLIAEGLVGAVLSVIHARLLERAPAALTDLLGPMMEMIALPYLGAAAARRELSRSTPRISEATPAQPPRAARDPLSGLEMRVTYRTLRVLSVISEHAGVSNREVAEHAGVSDQGQVSKLLTRLRNLGLVDNRGEGHTKGATNAWHLTPRGEQIQRSLGVRGA